MDADDISSLEEMEQRSNKSVDNFPSRNSVDFPSRNSMDEIQLNTETLIGINSILDNSRSSNR